MKMKELKMSNTNYVIAVLADIHWGKTSSPDIYYAEMKEAVLDKLAKMKVLDAIVICGDYFDRVLSMHQDASVLAIKMIQDLINIAEDKKAKLRIILGTKSHDNDMLKWFSLLSNESKADISVIYKVSTEELFDNFNVLYLPEEYIDSYEDYYGEYFIPNKYDMIFGHGLIDKASFVSKMQESEFTSIHAPVFKSDDLLTICKGPIFFGHIHTPMVIKDRIYYIGSVSRYAFGEEKDKGFIITYYSSDNSKYKNEYIVNDLAPKYNTYKFNINESTNEEDLLREIKDTTGDYIRLKFNNHNASQALLLTLSNLNSKRVKVVIEDSDKTKQLLERDEKTKFILSEYNFLFDKNINYDEKIFKYLCKKGIDHLSTDRIREILYQKYLN